MVEDVRTSFYRELKPVNVSDFHPAALAVGAKALLCLRGMSPDVSPEIIMATLQSEGQDPATVLQEYSDWVNSVTAVPVEAAAPIKFDGGLMDGLYRAHNIVNPFGHRGEDISSLARGLFCSMDIGLKSLGILEEELPHNALRDAQIQAIQMRLVLDLMEINLQTRGGIVAIFADGGMDALRKDAMTRELFAQAKSDIRIIRSTPIWEELTLAA